MRRRTMLAGVAVLATVWWWHGRGEHDEVHGEPRASRPTTPGSEVGSGELAPRDGHVTFSRSGRVPGVPVRRTGAYTISGTVIDRDTRTPVGGVEVVFRGDGGEESVTADADGSYRIELARGRYRAFVRDDAVMSVGLGGRERLPSSPEAETVGLPDEAAMAVVMATRDTGHVDLRVVRGGTITGHVRDPDGHPIARAIVRATGNGRDRPVLGTDVVETDDDGGFALRVPTGGWVLDASHGDYAGTLESNSVWVQTNAAVERDITLVAGCVITGHVIASDGGAAGDGAIEKQWGSSDDAYSPAGKIASDGTFRWVTTDTGNITLRAWPWKSPPSPARTFACGSGARFDDVVFRIPDRGPDIEGTLADADGNPVPLAFIDLAPLDPGGISQQERTDRDGRWGVFHMPAGRYRVTAYVQGRGVVSQVIRSPQRGVALELGGTGRLEGSIAGITDGSFRLRLASCTLEGATLAISDDERVVGVTAGRFSIDGVPACALRAIALSDHAGREVRATIPHDGSATIAIDDPTRRPESEEEHAEESEIEDIPDEPFDDSEGILLVE